MGGGIKKRKTGAEAEDTSLCVDIGRLRLKNPVITASGTFGYGLEFAGHVDLNRLGAIAVKGLSMKPRPGNPGPRIVETPCGMINAIGLQNVGVDAFLREKLPKLRRYDTMVIANIFGETVKDYGELAKRLDSAEGVAALEINISCPNVKKGGLVFGTDPKEAYKVVRKVRRSTRLPLITKLSPNVADVRPFVKAAEDAGTDAVSLINTIPAMAIDVERKRPCIARGIGGLSGPAIRPIAVRMVWEAYNAAKVPIIGMGGIMNARDALEFIIAGATAVEVGTANFIDPAASIRILEGISEYLKKHSTSVSALVGSLKIG